MWKRVESVWIEKLDAWQKAVDYAAAVYEVTKTFPTEERFGLTNQLRRSSVSVSSNLAEGSSRSSKADFKRFIEIAYGSLLETVSQIKVAQKQEFVNKEAYEKLYDEAEQLAKMLSGLRRSLDKRS